MAVRRRGGWGGATGDAGDGVGVGTARLGPSLRGTPPRHIPSPQAHHGPRLRVPLFPGLSIPQADMPTTSPSLSCPCSPCPPCPQSPCPPGGRAHRVPALPTSLPPTSPAATSRSPSYPQSPRLRASCPQLQAAQPEAPTGGAEPPPPPEPAPSPTALPPSSSLGTPRAGTTRHRGRVRAETGNLRVSWCCRRAGRGRCLHPCLHPGPRAGAREPPCADETFPWPPAWVKPGTAGGDPQPPGEGGQHRHRRHRARAGECKHVTRNRRACATAHACPGSHG